MNERRYGPEEIIFNPLENVDNLYILMNGQVCLFAPTTSDSKKPFTNLHTLHSGDIFGEISFFTGQ